MPNLVDPFKLAVQAAYPGAVIVGRGANWLRHQHPTDPSRFILDTAIGPLHYDADGAGNWQEINTDWGAGTETGFTNSVSAASFLAHDDDTGRRRIYPRRNVTTEFVEFAALQAWNGAVFVNVPWTTKTVQGDTITFDRANATLVITHTGAQVKILVVLKDSSAAARIRWPVSLTGLTRSGWNLIANSDSATVTMIAQPVIVSDGSGPLLIPRPVTASVVGGAVEFNADLSGLIFPITIDPTLDLIVGTGADDTRRDATPNFTATSNGGFVGEGPGVPDASMSLRFTGVSGLSGATINSATVFTPRITNNGTAIKTNIYAEKAAAPTAPTSDGDFTGRTLTTAVVAWNNQTAADVYTDSPSIASVIQELANAFDPSAIQIFWKNNASAANNYFSVRTYEDSSAWAATLHIEYTEGGPSALNVAVTPADATYLVPSVKIIG